MGRCVFPFAAVIGQERVKKALLLNAINPRIGGVLISGEKGTAKSTLVRGLADILDGVSVIDLPLNVTEDRLVGSINIESAIVRGRRDFEPGLLHRADGNILYIDEVNLLSEHIANCLLETAASGVNVVEREGISHRHMARFILIGTMNPEEGTLRPQITDRFGLYAEVHGETDVRDRMEIIKRRLDYERDPAGYRCRYQPESETLATQIVRARDKLPAVAVTDTGLTLAALVARQGGCAGHRAEIIIIETARAIAALDGRQETSEADIREAASYALPHRIREPVQVREEESEPDPDTPSSDGHDESDPSPDDIPDDESLPGPVDMPDGTDSPGEETSTEPGTGGHEEREAPSGVFDIEIADAAFRDIRFPHGSGKRARVTSGSRQGRYVKYRFPRDKVTDLAFDATLRAAAPHQLVRRENGRAVVIKAPDIREKVREKHTGCVVLFVVDASGSMGARRRMGAVKGAVLSLLGDVYRKRDRVGLIAFRNDRAETLLGITRSVELAHRRLEELPTGGKTPLAAGLYRAYETIKTARVREPDILPYLILVSDGRANVPLESANAVDDALRMAAKIQCEDIPAMVLDTENGCFRFGTAKKIAGVLRASYVKMDDITSGTIVSHVHQMVT